MTTTATPGSQTQVTIITIGRNSLAGLKETVASVDRQTYPQLRHVLIDGDSSDGSVHWLQALPVADNRTWVSEPDAGIYDAMNKALRHVDTGYLLYLHAGDTFVGDDVVTTAMEAIEATSPAPDIAIGWSRLVAGNGPLPYVVGGATPNAITSAHESTFFSAEFHLTERYDTSLQLAADYAFFRELALRRDLNILRIETIVSHFVFGGRSNDPSFDGARFLERARIDARFGDQPTAWTYVRIALRMATRATIYRLLGSDKAAEFFLWLACRRQNSGARPLAIDKSRVSAGLVTGPR